VQLKSSHRKLAAERTREPPDRTVQIQELALRNARHHHPHRLDQKPCIAQIDWSLQPV